MRNTQALFIIVFLFPAILFAQEKSKNFSFWVNQAQRTQSSDSAIFYGEKALAVARGNKVIEQEIEAFYTLGNAYFQKQFTTQAIQQYIRGLNLAKSIQAIDKIERFNYKLAKVYQSEKLYERSNDYFLRTLELVNPKRKAFIYNLQVSIGENFTKQKKYEEAIEFFDFAFESATQLDSKDLKLKVLQQLAQLHYQKGNFNDFLSANQQILRMVSSPDSASLDELLALNNIGYSYKYLQKNNQAYSYFSEALILSDKLRVEPNVKATILVNMAIISQNRGNLEEAIKRLIEADKTLKNSSEYGLLGSVYQSLFNLYFEKDDLFNAEIYNNKLAALAQKTANKDFELNVRQNRALLFQELEQYQEAINALQGFLSLRDSLLLEERINQQNLLDQQTKIQSIEKELELLLAEEAIKDLEINSLKLKQLQQDQELSILRQENLLKEEKLKNELLLAEEKQKSLLLAEQILKAEQKEQELRILSQEKNISDLKLREIELLDEERNAKIELLTKENEVSVLEIKQAESTRWLLLAILVVLVVVFFIIYRSFLFVRKSNRILREKNILIQQRNNEIKAQNMLIEAEREKVDNLLLNILPKNTAEELKEQGSAIPQFHTNVAIIFVDFKNFSEKAFKLSPVELVAELNLFFESFDDIIDLYGVEKIKTVGDAYMCASGLPEPVVNASEMAIKTAKAFIQKINEINKLTTEKWSCRIGIHTGDVISGVVGKKKFAYDIWGDSVNVASQIEKNAPPNGILVSEVTYNEVKDKFSFIAKGKIRLKHQEEIEVFEVV
jgi:adenylate cyclase